MSEARPMDLPITPGEVAEVRHDFWQGQFRPVALRTGDNVPQGKDWVRRARQDPPEAAIAPVRERALNTAILADGKYLIDFGIHDAVLMVQLKRVMFTALPVLLTAPTRWQSNSPCILVMARPPSGEPRARQIVGPFGRIEILGAGQQALAHGEYPSGVRVHWTNFPRGMPVDMLPVLTEADIDRLLDALAPLLGE